MDMMLKNEDYARLNEKTREKGFLLSGQNRGLKSTVISANRYKLILNARSWSDIKSLCKLLPEYRGFIRIENKRFSKKIGASFLQIQANQRFVAINIIKNHAPVGVSN